MVKLSVLVPIYNVERYLQECLDSLINQTLEDFEIICINDGSTDSSSQILREYAQKDSRIKLINKENSGYGASMNRGLQEACGEYIGIVESDDFVDKKMFEDLYNLATRNNADIVKSDYYYYTTENNQSRKAGKISKYRINKVINARKYKKLLKMQPTIWNAIYKREFLNRNEIDFLETPGASYQDTSFAFKTLACAERIVLTDKAYLYYRQDNINSSVHSKEKVFQICNEYDELTEFLEKRPTVKQYANSYKLIKQYRGYIWNLKRIDEKFRESFIDVFAKTFAEFKKNGELDKEFYSKVSKKEVELLLNDRVKFKDFCDRMSKKEVEKVERKKLFSVRINPSRISIVMFGKQIVEIE